MNIPSHYRRKEFCFHAYAVCMLHGNAVHTFKQFTGVGHYAIIEQQVLCRLFQKQALE